MSTHPLPTSSSYAARISFMIELARHLHAYGTTAQRLEGALMLVSRRLGLECEAWLNPTGMILTFSDPDRPPGESDTTRVIRLAPGDTHLFKLSQADRIAEDVMAGTMALGEGYAALRALNRPASRREKIIQALAFGLAAAAVAGLLRLPWLDIATAGTTGVLIGSLEMFAATRPRLKEAADAIAAMLAGFVAIAVSTLVAPLNLNTVVIASLIVLLPGMGLTNAMNELTSQHLVSGTARLFGALTTVMKLAIGTMIALTVAQMLGIDPMVRGSHPQPRWVEGVSLLVAAFAFSVLFRASRRDIPIVMLAAVTGYLISRLAGGAWGSSVGIFLSALVITAGGNIFARRARRPGALVRVPGIIMLVPGSVSLRGVMTLLQQQDVAAGQQALLAVLNILLALIAGLLFGNLLAPTRRNL